MDFFRIKVGLLLACLCTTGFAGSRWLVTAGGGYSFNQYNSSMSINNNSGFVPPFNQDIYTTKKQNQGLLLLAFGRQWTQKTNWFPAISLSAQYQYGMMTNIGGTVTQYSDPTFTNYTYHWNLSSNSFLANAKLNLFRIRQLSPYVNMALGGVINILNSYSETPLPGVTLPRTSPDFGASDWQFTYQLGAGFDFECTQNIFVTLGYLYQDFGHLNSANGAGSWSNRALELGGLTTNSVFISMTYLFNPTS